MIADRSVFDDTWSPDHLLHRDAAVDQLSSAVVPSRLQRRGQDVLISGPPGVGKSVLARHTLSQLADDAGIQWTRVECMGQTTAGIIREVLAAIGPRPARNTPREDLALSLRERVDEPLAVVLDEAAEVHDTKALERLADVEAISLVVVAYDADDWLAQAPRSIAARFHGQRIALDRYGVDELADILEPRVATGLERQVLSRQQLERIADDVAGVARHGIYSVLAAAELAVDRGHYTVREMDVDDAYDVAREWMRQAALDSLALHHHVLYELVREAGTISGEALHRRYETVADGVYQGRQRQPLSERSQRRKLAKLVEYDLIEREGASRDRSYSVLDEAVRSAYDLGVAVEDPDM
ncbi:Cdc6/Cdc18 family protein [Halomicroarcula sp. GCM10025709]|uniref:Cdc6/Cdc18 family protein n=1 Tax=Haloarcula TaxID=2237 RepID=UPI0024C387B2|nr:AAA family ATPase [Halomicroarcula sp. YJ-61-S]